MTYLHLWPEDKFTKSSIEFFNNNFNPDIHYFIVVNKKKFESGISSSNNVRKLSNSFMNLLIINIEMYKHKRVYLHSLFNVRILIILCIQPWLLRKCNWIIWGGDLYSYETPKKTIKQKIYEFMRSYCIKNMGGLITHVKGDYQLAKDWYGAKGKYYYSFMYPSNLYKEYDLPRNKNSAEKIYIQVGNSADPSNKHIEILYKLFNLNEKEYEIICPLSYGGNSEYTNLVIKKGEELFGERFTALTTFIPFEEYIDILAKINIAIFNHQRQQAMGNITTLLSLGKKVYIRNDITTWQFVNDHDLKVYNTYDDFQFLFEKINHNVKKNNIANMKKYFSEEKLIRDLKIIFDEEISR